MRLFAALVASVLLAGCSIIPGVAEVQGAFVVGTDKTIEDHIISWTSGKDCSSVRKEQGLTYCVEDEPTVTPNVYCYKTLGSVDCFDRPDPHKGRHQKIGENDQNRPK
ncbi:MAG: hypothetical protein ACE5GT_01810 [Rhodospirillales bacterium]